ncbi:hypothetical protein GOODEAATRI_017012 [Goodea atripinnis]|uniref:Uncharacterized protein n=1 Tax=Goodea atripinnis TaxID=208336 RepID=A0ABV0PER6_9TELE
MLYLIGSEISYSKNFEPEWPYYVTVDLKAKTDKCSCGRCGEQRLQVKFGPVTVQHIVCPSSPANKITYLLLAKDMQKPLQNMLALFFFNVMFRLQRYRQRSGHTKATNGDKSLKGS